LTTAFAKGPELPFDVEVEAEFEGNRIIVRSIRATHGEITSEALRQVPVVTILSLESCPLVGTMNIAGMNLGAARMGDQRKRH
jgi:hypothetical protein